MTKINKLLSLAPPQAILTSTWLRTQGYSTQLIQSYIKTGWLEAIGSGAFKRKNNTLTIFGGLWALSQDTPPSIHIGGKSALEYQGFGHNISFSNNTLILFSSRGQIIPKWFRQAPWDYPFLAVQTTCFKTANIPIDPLQTQVINGCSIFLSTPELAILEACYLAPQNQGLEELNHFMESLTSLRPNLLQQLLEQCTSIKVKRLFLFSARRYKHPWFDYLNEQSIDLGVGKRSMVTGGKLDKQYHITLPKEWFDEI